MFVEGVSREVAAFEYPCGNSNDNGVVVQCPSTGAAAMQPQLVIAGNARRSRGHTDRFGVYTLYVPIRTTVRVNSFCNGCRVTLTKAGGTASVDILGFLHWSWDRTKMYVFLPDGVTDSTWNSRFSTGDLLVVSNTIGTGMPASDNRALTHVYGRGSNQRIRRGMTQNVGQ